MKTPISRAWRSVLLLPAVWVASAASQSAHEPQQALTFYKAASRGAIEGLSPAEGRFEIPPVAEWRWFDGAPGCSLSPMAQRIDRAARAADDGRLPSPARLTTMRNAVGPTLVDSQAIFKGAARLIETADHEIDLISFAMEPDAQPYLDLLAAFERRLTSGKPLGRPFRIRFYADHLSMLFLARTARPKARALLTPWLALFEKHKLDPDHVRLEVYVHAHGALLYHRGGRYSVHDKFMVVDGRYLHIGGANPQKKNNYLHPERDTAVVMKGEVASVALAAFDSLWGQTDFSCSIERSGNGYRKQCRDRRTPFPVEHAAAVTSPSLDEIGLAPNACLPMTVLSKGKRGFVNVGGDANPWAKGLLAAVDAATSRIELSSPNMNAPPLQAALVDAMTRRDVRVSLLLPFQRNEHQVNYLGGYGSNEHTLKVMKVCALDVRLRSHDQFERFTRNFQPAWWVAEGDRQRFVGDGPGCFHTKFASFDGSLAMIGSANLDDQSFYHSSETSIAIDSEVVTRALARSMFDPEWRRAERAGWRRPFFADLTAGREFHALTPANDVRHLCAGLLNR